MDTPRRRAERAVQELLERMPVDATLDSASVIASQPPELREDVARLLEDLQWLRGAFGGTTLAGGSAAVAEAAVAGAAAPGGAGALAGSMARLALAPDLLLGDFRLVQEIGRGGMAVVWEAEQVSLARRVALKILRPPPGLERARVARFLREAAAGGRLNHRHIVAVHAVGEDAGLHFLALELVPGGRTLADAIEEARALPELPADHARRQVERAAAVAEALAVAHAAGVVHRDVKPGNVLLLPDGTPKLADFGLAVLADSPGLSASGELTGTPFYMSPEQAAGRRERVDARSDVFSLGATLYEQLTLRRPFEGDTTRQVLDRILLDDPPVPHVLRSRVPRELSWICLKALEKSPERRYASAAELAADLHRWLVHEPIVARAPGSLRRAAKWTLRHPVASVGGAVAAAGLAATLTLLVEARTAREEALHQAGTAQAVTAYVKRLFFQTSPFESYAGATRDPPISEVFARGLDDIGSLDGQPAVQADVRRLLGDLLRSAGRYDGAESFLVPALGQSVALYGPDDERTLQVVANLADVRLGQGRLEEAETLARDAARARTPALALVARGTAATAATRLGRFDDAERELRALEQDTAAAFGADHEDVLRVRAQLGKLLTRAGRPEEARAVLQPTLTEWRTRFGEDHPNALDVQSLLANALMPLQRFAEAEALYRDLAERSVRVLGENAPLSAGTLYNLAALVDGLRRPDEARVLYERALELFAAGVGADNPDAIAALENLAILHARGGRLKEAEPLMLRALELRRGNEARVRDAAAVDGTLKALFNLAILRASHGRTDEAEAGYREIVAAACEMAGAQPGSDVGARRGLLALVNLLLLLQQQGRLDEAIAAQEAVGSLRAPTLESWHNARMMRGALLLAKGELASAEVALREALLDVRGQFGDQHDVRLWGLGQLGSALLAQGRREEAREAWAEMLGQAVAARGTADPRAAEARTALAQLAEEQGCVPDP